MTQPFQVSAKMSVTACAILLLLFICSFILLLAIMAGLIGDKNSHSAAYLIAPLASFTSSSLFYIRKTYLIRFSSPSHRYPAEHDVAFLLYVLTRPAFGALCGFIFVLILEHLVRSVTTDANFSDGFTILTVITGLLLGTVTGPAVDLLLKLGHRATHKLDGP